MGEHDRKQAWVNTVTPTKPDTNPDTPYNRQFLSNSLLSGKKVRIPRSDVSEDSNSESDSMQNIPNTSSLTNISRDPSKESISDIETKKDLINFYKI